MYNWLVAGSQNHSFGESSKAKRPVRKNPQVSLPMLELVGLEARVRVPFA